MKKVVLTAAVMFCVLFVGRLMYGYTKKVERPYSGEVNNLEFVSPAQSFKRNYATKKYKQVDNTSVQVDQKYEKIADVKSTSTKFEEDEKRVRKYIKSYNALVQFENKSGNNGARAMQLVIGVPPEHFDDLYQQLVKVGIVLSKQITKNDKTNEYKELNAKKTSLMKLRNSLIELKSKGGNIGEYINLENRILDVEQQLQAIGVNLGDFDAENEFCTVKLSISETVPYVIGLPQRLKVAFDWTVKAFLKLSFGFLFLALSVYLLSLIKTKMIKS